MRKVDSLSVFAPVREGHLDALKALLGAWPEGEQSPVKRLKGTHMARFLVVPHLKKKTGAPLDDTPYLLFSADFDGTAEAYLDMLVTLPEIREVFSHCAGLRDDPDPESFRRFLGDYTLRPGYSVVAFPEADLEAVLKGLDLRKDLADFALRTRGFDAASLKQEWLTTFGNDGQAG